MKRNTKKSQQKQKKALLNQRRTLFGALILLIAAVALYSLIGWAYQSFYVQPREARVEAFIERLALDSSLYQFQRRDGVSFEYWRGAAVADATREVNEKVAAAGLEKVVVVSVVSKPYRDYRADRLLMGESLEGLQQFDPNTGPSVVTVTIDLKSED